ncbi:MAG: methyltransferase [Planctomycetaceae bacterium]
MPRDTRPRKTGRSGKKKSTSSGRDHSQPRGIADRLILEQTDQILPGNALMVLITGTALAKHLTDRRPELNWNIFTCEHFYLTAIVNALSDLPEDTAGHGAVELFCMPDLPEAEYDTVVFPTDAKGSSELTRELLQTIAVQLKPEGRLIVSTNNARDHWLQTQLKDMFGRTTVIKNNQGICYIARKAARPAKQRDFRCEFAFRDGKRLIRGVSRPGVFSHRRIDPGARALIRSLDLIRDDARFARKPLKRIIEMGCGTGTVSTAAGLRYPDATVVAVDSHARAVQATEQTAAINGANNVTALLTSDGLVPAMGTHDLFLCNPPYYSDYRISELFLESADQSLRPGGRIHLVTKLTDWHQNRMIERFANAEVHRFGDYDVIVSKVR